jgi:hypothetical protein
MVIVRTLIKCSLCINHSQHLPYPRQGSLWTYKLAAFSTQTNSQMGTSRIASEITPLVQSSKKLTTPLPKLQIGILMIYQLAEPIASMSIFPYINQV